MGSDNSAGATMTAIFAQRDRQRILSELQQWYAPATASSRSGKGRKRREDRSGFAERCGSKFFDVMELGQPQTERDAVNQVGAALYPILWMVLRPLLISAVREIVEWLWKRTR